MPRINTKAKGTAAERELIHMLWGAGWAAIRVAGSGSSRYPSPDIIAGNARRKIAIECKITRGEYQYLDEKEIRDLEIFCKAFGAEGYIAVKFAGYDWFFLTLEDLRMTGLGFSITPTIGRNKGLLFEELTEG